MGIGFKTGLFGYSKQEVNGFIQTQAQQFQKAAMEKDAQLSQKEEELKQLRQTLEKLSKQQEELKSQLTFLNGQLEHYRGREEEIEKMSIGIGTMYLASRQNATEVLQRTERCAEAVAAQSKKQLAAAARTGDVLAQMRTDVLAAAEGFSKQVEAFAKQLDEAVSGMEAGLEGLNAPFENALLEEEQHG